MQFFTALAVLAAAAVSVEAGAAPERNSPWFPFYNLSCRGCLPGGNLLPSCVKVTAANVCSSVKPTPAVSIPCLRVGYATAAGSAGSAATAKTANALSASATVSGSQITCDADSTIDSSCIVLTDASFPANFVIPSDTTITGAQVTGPLTTATLSGAQVTSTVSSATNLACPANATANSLLLGSCYYITGAQVTGALGSGATVTGAQVTTGTIPSNVTFNGTIGSSACTSVKSCLGITINEAPGGTCNAGSGGNFTVTCDPSTDFVAGCELASIPALASCSSDYLLSTQTKSSCSFSCPGTLTCNAAPGGFSNPNIKCVKFH